jgi:hypothetical protein
VGALCALMSGPGEIDPDRGEKGSPGARSDGRILMGAAVPGGVIMEREEEAKPCAFFGMSAARRRWS